jgi:acetyl/propionyl-CoA carboxylase alpha subunit
MRRALGEYHVGGIRTNLPFHRRVMRHPAFVAGDYDTGFIERHRAELQPLAPNEDELDQAAIAAALAAIAAEAGSRSADASDQISVWRRDLLPK